MSLLAAEICSVRIGLELKYRPTFLRATKTSSSAFWTTTLSHACANLPSAMPSLWHLGLLLSFLYDDSVCLDTCVLGIVGHPVALPCVSDGLRPDSGHNNVSAGNVSVEWRTEDEVVFRWVWEEDAASHTGTWSVLDDTNTTRVSTDAPTTGNFTLELSSVPDPKETRTNYSLFVLVSGEEQRPALCNVCLVTAASFSSPLLQREEPEEGTGEETHFLCQSSGGFPAPSVQWLINDTQEPPEGSVISTHKTPLRPGSPLYNVTSRLAVTVSPDTRVSCVIHNLSMNQTLTSTSDGDQVRHVPSRAAEAMWMFSLGLCVAVGAMVLAAIAYQVHLDRNNYKHYPTCKADYHLGDVCDRADKMRRPLGDKCQHQDKERRVTIDLEQVDSLIETDV